MALLAAGLSACSAVPDVNISRFIGGEPPPAPTRIPVRPTAVPANLSTAGVVARRGVLRIGVRFDAPPLSSVNDAGEVEGMDVELARELAKRWLGDARKVEFVQVTSVTAPEKVRDREIDLAMGGLARTRNAEELVDFSQPYFEDGEAILTRAGAFTSTRQLARQTLQYVDFGSLGVLRELQESNGFTLTLRSNVSYPRAMADLRAGRAAGVAGNLRRLRVEAVKDPQFQVFLVTRKDSVVALLPENDSAWVNMVNASLATLISDGTYGTLYKKWMQIDAPAVSFLPGTQSIGFGTLRKDRTLPQDTLADMRASKIVRVGWLAGADGLARLDASNRLTGFEVSLAREMARRWFGNENAATFSTITAATLPSALAANQIDFAIGGIAINFANTQVMDLIGPSFVPNSALTRTLTIQAPVGFAVAQNASDRRDLIDLTLQDMISDGTYARIYTTTANFGNRAQPPTLPVLRGTFSPIADLAVR